MRERTEGNRSRSKISQCVASSFGSSSFRYDVSNKVYILKLMKGGAQYNIVIESGVRFGVFGFVYFVGYISPSICVRKINSLTPFPRN